MGIKDEVLPLIRDDYNQNGYYSFLYEYFLNHNDKLKKKLQDNPENKREAIVRKYIQDTMNNYGYPLSYKESTKEKTSDPPLDGNGRMSRLMTLLLLYRSGYMVGQYISIEKAIADTK